MKIIVAIPSEDYRSNAGARIRYGRIVSELERFGVDFEMQDIGKFDPRKALCDVFIVSKCLDSRAHVAAALMAKKGASIGVDLFDDYFSQQGDSRLFRQRLWLRQMLALSDFAMTSTNAMAAIVADYHADLPVHVLNDPSPAFDGRSLEALIERKRDMARAGHQVRLLWFGIGDNPHFPVGLRDLAAYGPALRGLTARGLDVQLSILTNARALSAEGLARINELPVPATIGLWSEELEAQELQRSFACFLPVNAQPFSLAKSLNRAVTALSMGCQVLTAGAPLYARLAEFIYDDAGGMADDILQGELRHSGDRLPRFGAAIADLASPGAEAERLRDFLAALRRQPPPADLSRLLLLHGVTTNGTAHKMAQSMGGLSIASPYCSAAFNFDIMFEAREGLAPRMLVSDELLPTITLGEGDRAVSAGKRRDRSYWEVGADADRSSTAPPPPAHAESLPHQLALYAPTMQACHERLARLFPGGKIILSEMSPLPFDTSDLS